MILTETKAKEIFANMILDMDLFEDLYEGDAEIEAKDIRTDIAMIAGAQNYLDALLREMENEEQPQEQSAWDYERSGEKARH